MIIKILHVILLASVKYFITLPYAMIIGLDYKQAIIAVLIGGIGGFLVFFYLSKPLLIGFSFLLNKLCKLSPPAFKYRYQNYCAKRNLKRPSQRFSRKTRIIAKIKSSYGFWGIILTTPFFLTIPVGAFLANKYYSKRKNIVLYMILSIIGWAVIISGVVHLFPNIFL